MASRPISISTAILIVVLGTGPARGQVPDHLQCYRVEDAQGRAAYTTDLDGLAPAAGCKVRVPGKLLCVQTTKSNTRPTPPGNGSGGPARRFVCYPLKCPRAALPAVGWTDQFGSRTLTPRAPKMLCAPEILPTTTVTTTSTTSTTACGGLGLPCGRCAGGHCAQHAGATSLVCVSDPCTASDCVSDAGCAEGQACVMAVAGDHFCCPLCP